MPVKGTDLAWLGGYMDGEGTIGLHRRSKITQRQPHWERPYILPTFCVSNTDKRLVDHSAEIIEAIIGIRPSVVVCRKAGDGFKKMWRVSIVGQRRLSILLPSLIPYLISKRRQAELLLDFCIRRPARQRHTSYERNELDLAAYHECLALNQRGAARPEGGAKSPLQLVREA